MFLSFVFPFSFLGSISSLGGLGWRLRCPIMIDIPVWDKSGIYVLTVTCDAATTAVANDAAANTIPINAVVANTAAVNSVVVKTPSQSTHSPILAPYHVTSFGRHRHRPRRGHARWCPPFASSEERALNWVSGSWIQLKASRRQNRSGYTSGEAVWIW